MGKVPLLDTQALGEPIREMRKVWQEFLKCPYCDGSISRDYLAKAGMMQTAYSCECSNWRNHYNFLDHKTTWERIKK